jgi:hypothetical protein
VHAAPPVRVRVHRGALWPAFVGAATAAAAGNVVAWGLYALDLGAAWPTALLAAAVAGGAAAAWAQRSSGEGELSWDGAQWRWQDRPGDVQATIDLGNWLLLRVAHDAGTRCWVAAGRAATDGPWSALRAALYSRRPSDPLDAPPPA